MPRGIIKRLIPAISSIREVAADIQKEEYEKPSSTSKQPFKETEHGSITDHDGTEAMNFKLKGLSDLIEEK